MIHDHPFAEAGAIGGRCRICTANDVDAVIEQLAQDLWESRRHGTLDDWPWAEAGSYWQETFRDFATTAVHSLRSNEL